MATTALQLCVRRSPSPLSGGNGLVVHLEMPSDVECIEQAVSLVTRHCLSGTRCSERLRFRLQVALSEAIANAVICGNRENLATRVFIEAELSPEIIRVSVTDEGDGFDPANVPEPIRPEQLFETCGRGLFLIRKLVDDVRFNEQGNSICMTLRRR
jgi:serine/threonine-protein kinase RsbW